MQVFTPRQRCLFRLAPAWAWACAALALAWSFAASVAAQGLGLRYHAQPEGLGNLVVTALVQSPDGRLWIATENGLYRHDGARIERVEDLATVD